MRKSEYDCPVCGKSTLNSSQYHIIQTGVEKVKFGRVVGTLDVYDFVHTECYEEYEKKIFKPRLRRRNVKVFLLSVAIVILMFDALNMFMDVLVNS